MREKRTYHVVVKRSNPTLETARPFSGFGPSLIPKLRRAGWALETHLTPEQQDDWTVHKVTVIHDIDQEELHEQAKAEAEAYKARKNRGPAVERGTRPADEIPVR